MTCLDDSGYMFCVSSCAYGVFFFFYVKVNSDPEVVVLLSGVSGITLNGEVCTVVFSFPFLHLESGQYAMSPLYLAVTVRCLVCGAMLGSTMDTCSASAGWLLDVFTIST